MSDNARSSGTPTTPSSFPFASTRRGGPSSKAPRTSEAVRSPIRISSGTAACSRRAATLTASPLTKELPSRGRPTTTSPVFTPGAKGELALEERLQAAAHRKRAVERALRVVLERGGSAERGHHRIAGELLHRASGALDLRRHRLVEAVERRTRALGILRACQRRRADEIGEQHGRELPLVRRRCGVASARRTRGRTERRPATGRHTGRRRP